ncbi:TetR/AcrR family transcriptional regulator [Novosphingobium sp. G106]|uniref:TetR/AcrR family transcriptional regulator n=1 Tax=Novosphingobium sp. G106 TaxID=2849500 RepID=UPI001C2D2E91|nr:TetR/AcrR family transcriptional regulator [Novosphingobium sp. G106]MBV1688722.1 TetR/AcrR family transcriptional regulator [Novosphingobium sp. G106]
MDEDTTASGTRERKKDETRARIADDVIALMAEGRLDISHDLVAERTGIARRTIYRYFPDRQELLGGASTRVRELAGPGVRFPESEADLTGTLLDTYTGFDRIAPITTLMRSTPQGRAMRMAQNDMRVERYTAVTADAVKDLPQEDRKLATALLQMLHTTPWLEMRDHWGLTGEEIARATGWAIRTLLADLRSRGDRPLSD